MSSEHHSPPNKKIRMSSKQEIEQTSATLSTTAIETITKNNNNNQSSKQKTKPFRAKSHYVQKFELKNTNFEKYYKKQRIITDPNEWNLFIKTLQTELPTSFRFNPSSKLHKIFKQKLLNDEFNLKKAEKDKLQHEGITFAMPYPLPFYPYSMGWQCNFPKRFLNKHKEYFKSFRNFLIECNEIGIISRQETVSMIPALFLNKYLCSQDIVLDVCAAPGNKTAQVLELLHYNLNGEYLPGKHNGFIFANDADEKRAHVMVHQLKRIGINGFLITNKLAQCIPKLKDINGVNMKIDSIICDVPCSSDGTLRKAPDLWNKWSTSYGNGLHAVQLSILIHALHLVKPGGYVVYSTCSLNPIENEAVIASALLKLNKYYSKLDEISVELVDCDKDVIGLKRNKGLSEWIVWDKNLNDDCFYSKYNDAQQKRRRYIKPTMFPPLSRDDCNDICDDVIEYLRLDHCMRFLPHFHDTGAFFVAVLHKKEKEEHKDDLLDNDTLFKIEKREFDRKNVWNDNVPFFKLEQWKDHKIQIQKIVEFYGLNVNKDLTPYFDVNDLLVRGLKNPRSLWFVPAAIGNIIANTDNHRLRVVHSGCRAFVRHDTKVTEHACKWRLCQDGALYLSKYCSKQIVSLPIELYLMYCFVGKLEFDELCSIDDGKYGVLINDTMRKQTGGPIIIVLNCEDVNDIMFDTYRALSGWKSFKRIDLMVKKQQILLLQNHLKDIYREQCIDLDKKYDNINIDFDVNNRSTFNAIKNQKKKETKKDKFKRKRRNRDWVHKKKNNNTHSK